MFSGQSVMRSGIWYWPLFSSAPFLAVASRSHSQTQYIFRGPWHTISPPPCFSLCVLIPQFTVPNVRKCSPVFILNSLSAIAAPCNYSWTTGSFVKIYDGFTRLEHLNDMPFSLSLSPSVGSVCKNRSREKHRFKLHTHAKKRWTAKKSI